MALITCPECGRQISDMAESCPGCGCPKAVWEKKNAAAPLPAVGECFELGSWDGEPLEWRVLSAGEDGVLALCEQAVDCQPFCRNAWGGNDWEGSHLQKWLKGQFASAAFSADERLRIAEVTCLSIEEAGELFADNAARLCPAGRYAMQRGAYTDEDTEACCWWLRTPADEELDALYVDMYGRIHPYGCSITDTGVGVRPAIRLK